MEKERRENKGENLRKKGKVLGGGQINSVVDLLILEGDNTEES